MPVSFFIVPYEGVPGKPANFRRCAMDQFTSTIQADAGDWREVEFLGNRALVKVRASASTLTDIATTTGWFRFPLAALDNSLSSLSTAQRTAIRDQATAAGYTLAEFNANIPNLATATLRDVLRFLVSRRLQPRWTGTQLLIDGPVQPTIPLESLEVVQ